MFRIFPALTFVGFSVPGPGQSRTPRTLRVDYYHTGGAAEEYFSLDQVVLEPVEWPGNPSHLLDDTNLGKYYFEVISRSTNRVLYSRGFSSIFGEWETTGKSENTFQTFHESLRFPEPSEPVQVVLKKRDSLNAFREVWSLILDPQDQFIDQSEPLMAGPLITIQRSGDSSGKVDFLIVGEGYTSAEKDKCEGDARRMVEALFQNAPFDRRRSDFNVWLLCPPSRDSGISRPSTGIHRRTPLETTYDFFGAERYAMTKANRAFREIASQAPYEFVEILMNARTYGGGGIFGQYATVAVDNGWAEYVFVHEFGHHFAALGDEYYTSPDVYAPVSDKVEPWEPNVTASPTRDRLKWGDLVSEKTPLPTPWGKQEFEEHSRLVQEERARIRLLKLPEQQMEELFEEQRKWETSFLKGKTFADAVGAFEGAMYEARGYFRPEIDCIMFSRNRVPFCQVCQQAIERVIDLYSGEGSDRN